MTEGKMPFGNIVEKRENAGTMFSSISRGEIIILATFNLSSANAFNLNQCKILSLGSKGLKKIKGGGLIKYFALSFCKNFEHRET